MASTRSQLDPLLAEVGVVARCAQARHLSISSSVASSSSSGDICAESGAEQLGSDPRLPAAGAAVPHHHRCPCTLAS